MALTNLSDDVVLMVIGACLDRPLIDFALTCRRVHHLSESTLKCRAEIKKWHTINLANGDSAYINYSHPIEVIAEIRKNPRIANLVTRIEYSFYNEGQVEYYCQHQPPRIRRLVESCNYLEDEIDAFGFLNDDEKQQWKQSVRRANANVCFMLLLSLCKKAKDLLMTDLDDEESESSNCIASIIPHMRNEEEREPGKYKETGVLGHFPAVTRLELFNLDLNLNFTVGLAWPMLCIPSVRVVEGYTLGDEYEATRLNWPDDFNNSEIEKFTLRHTYVHPNTIVELLRQLPRLREFIYDERHDYQNSRGRESWFSIQEFASCLEERGGDFFKERSYVVRVERLGVNKDCNGFEAIVVRGSGSKT